MPIKLPGQRVDISLRLQKLLDYVEAECKTSIQFMAIAPAEGFEGRFVWSDTGICIELRERLESTFAEYVAAHELGHVLQVIRGCAIAAGRVDEPGAINIATGITDFVLDSSADSIATEFEIPMASGLQAYLQSSGLLDVLDKPKNGRRYGNNWATIWEGLKIARVNRQLGIKPPQPPKEYWTLRVALDFANLIERSSNLGLTIGEQIFNGIKKVSLLSKIINDLLDIGALDRMSSVEESTNKLVKIFQYIEVQEGHIYISKPLTDEILTDGHWRPHLKGEDSDWLKCLLT